jgi:hypothetical protein
VRIPKRVRQAIELIATGEVTTQKAAAIRVGISPEHLCRMLARDQVQVFLRRTAAQNITGATLRASLRLVGLIDARSEHVAAKVSERILTSEGVLRADQTQAAVNVDVKAGFVIKLMVPAESSDPGNRRGVQAQVIEGTATASPFTGERAQPERSR